MPCCVIPNCHRKSKNKNICYFKLPQNRITRKQWVKACKLKRTKDIRFRRICSLHFKKSDFICDPGNQLKLKDTAVPCIFIGSNVSNEYSLNRTQKREIRSYLLDTQRRTLVKRFMDSFFDRRRVLKFLSDLYNSPILKGDKTKKKIKRLKKVVQKLNQRNKRLISFCNYLKGISAAKSKLLKKLLVDKQALVYSSK